MLLRTFVLTLLLLFSVSSFGQLSKQDAQVLYDSLYGTDPVSIPWTGSVANCEPGTVPDKFLRRAQDRVNYFRIACGLPPLVFKDINNQMAQAAALMMTANKQLSHAPLNDWKCYSAKGALGAERSNLGFQNFQAYGHNAFITGFVRDWGAPNYWLGHRRWILYTRGLYGGYGSTGVCAALFMVDTLGAPTGSRDFIAYPPPGHFPASLVFPKWSFAFPEGSKVDLTNAKIKMTTASGTAIVVRKLPYKEFLDPCISWEASGLFSEEEIKFQRSSLEAQGFVGQPITVEISDVVLDGERRKFNYQVTLFKAK